MATKIVPITNGNTLTGYRITPDRTTIGFVARGVRGRSHSPSIKEQHADCILPYGSLTSFSYDGNPACGSFTMNAKGDVLKTEDYELAAQSRFPDIRAQAQRLIGAEVAKKDDYMSGLLLIEAPKHNVDSFMRNWLELKEKPKNFHIIGGNCSTRAKDIFVASQIIPHVNFLIDTPSKLFAHLTHVLNNDPKYKITSFFGYFGLEKISDGVYDLIILVE